MLPGGILTASSVKEPVVATGGTINDTGGFRFHQFTSNGIFQIVSGGPVTVDYLVVAAGAGGGHGNTLSAFAGGGGGGGMLEGSLLLDVGSYSAQIGAGGAGGAAEATYGGAGGNSAFHTIVTTGGGGGAYCWFNGVNYYSSNAGSGGCGGGVGFYDGAGYVGGSGIAGQGYAGGSYSAGGVGSGGGGAGGPGGGGAAGLGRATLFFISSITFSVGGGSRAGTSDASYFGNGADGGYSFRGGNGYAGFVAVRYPYP